MQWFNVRQCRGRRTVQRDCIRCTAYNLFASDIRYCYKWLMPLHLCDQNHQKYRWQTFLAANSFGSIVIIKFNCKRTPTNAQQLKCKNHIQYWILAGIDCHNAKTKFLHRLIYFNNALARQFAAPTPRLWMLISWNVEMCWMFQITIRKGKKNQNRISETYK